MLSPLGATLIQSSILNAISNILAQLIDQYKHGKPLSLNVIALIQFVTYAVIIVPMNFSWQRYVEARFPGFPTTRGWRRGRASTSSSVVSSSPAFFTTPTAPPPDVLPRKEKPARDTIPAAGSNSGMRNFIIKFMLDQTIAGFVNIVVFIFLINLLKGASLSTIWELICKDFWPITVARSKFRPVVSFLLYTVVPVDRRVVFGSACGVIWGIYLSLYAAV
ncbi:peroxisomal membrane protein 2, pxmp2, putative [Paecilomyces variotii No. 5]|uniref:Peroxisomal membrane protein 2, pxmp2, putative n=1 Tax=Byssochlamys spectabilis (strain No. 5 / NBRC 109023) TaxID=1356009 RepID=V5G748_BYSSN|nr:peroxisomal membrane protein 2, pxmp2, putative [Paecilomyces variotii No. 5]